MENYVDVLVNHFDLPSRRVKRIIQCESGWNPHAFNAKHVDGRPKYGLLQFDRRTFTGADIWSWREQLDQGLAMMDDGQWRAWPTCSKF